MRRNTGVPYCTLRGLWVHSSGGIHRGTGYSPLCELNHKVIELLECFDVIDFKAKPLALAALVVDRVMSEVAASNGFPKM